MTEATFTNNFENPSHGERLIVTHIKILSAFLTRGREEREEGQQGRGPGEGWGRE